MSLHKLGIDFGTSNSTCAIVRDDLASLIPLEKSHTALPSAMFFYDEGGVLFGRDAISAYLDGEEGRFMRGLKSILGTSLMKEKTRVSKTNIEFTDIIKIYIRHLKIQAEKHVDSAIHDVVLGRPVHFHDNDTDADQASEDTLKQIASELGFKNISFQYEPIAAAFAHERNIKEEKLALVVDLGGGTSDFTVIRLSPQKNIQPNRQGDILSTSGIRVGGTNFDQKLSLSSFMPYLGLGGFYESEMERSKVLPIPPYVYYQLSDWPQVHFGQTPQAIRETKSILRTAQQQEKIERLLYLQETGLGHALLQVVEQTKISLTDQHEVTSNLRQMGLGFDVSVTRTDFEKSISDLVARILLSIETCLDLAGVQDSDIDLVILTGGSSELPVINQMIQRKMPHADISNDNKFGSVGLGLAYNASYL